MLYVILSMLYTYILLKNVVC